MQRAQRRGAVLKERFWWRRDIGAPKDVAPDASNAPDQYAEMTIDEIVNGKVRNNYKIQIIMITHTFNTV